MKKILGMGAAFAVLFLNGCCSSSVPLGQPMEKAVRPFRFEQDRFAFANETVWNYAEGKHAAMAKPLRPSKASSKVSPKTQHKDSGKKYTRRCFVMTRAALQFWKFARFTPRARLLAPQELVDRIRAVTAIDVWRPSLSRQERVEFPGYANLRALSEAEPQALQDNIGLGWPTYFRPGNMPIIFSPGKGHQERMHRFLQEHLKAGQPAVAWLVNFPSLSINHTVLVFDCRKKEGAWIYDVYDPNLPTKPLSLEYNPQTRVFSYTKTFYFEGGPVRVRPVYLSPFQ